MPLAQSRYIPALDGLRAFAVLAVIAYHMGFAWAPGGLLGVTVFFVLSGYLITSLLITEFRGSKTIDLRHFWLRRVRRLVPAIVTVVVATCALCVLLNHDLLTKLRPDVLPSLLFYSNWWQIFHDVSYFEAQGAPSPLQHFWSLAIEEQFYLVWPVLLLALFKRRTPPRAIRRGILVAAAASTLAMALLYQPEADPSRVYFGTDTRAFSLLIGAWLAFVWPSGALGGKVAPGARWALDGIGIAAFLGLAALVALSNGYDGFQYRGGILLCSVLSAVVIAIVVHPASRFARFWSLAPLVWVGKRSYGMYLWHFSILLLMTNQNATEAAPLWWNAIELVLIVGVSAASYTFIENPVRKGAIGAFVRRVRAGEVTVPRTLARHAVPAVAGCAITVVAAVGLVVVPPTNAVEGADAAAEQVDAEAQAQQNAQTAADRREAYDLLMIGDSVSVRCENIFPDYFPNGCLDAVVGRTMQKGQETYDRYRDMGAVGDRVVVALGTNGLVTLDQANAFIDDIDSDKRIWLVNTRSNEDWVTATNDALAQAAAQHDNVELIDWYAYSAGNDNLFSGDGKHLTAEAAQDYMTLIKQSVDGTDVDTNADTGSGADGGTPAGGDVSDGSTASA